MAATAPEDTAQTPDPPHRSREEFLSCNLTMALVLSDNVFSPLAWAIRHAQRREHQSGYWQHAMLYIGNGTLASQEWYLRTRRIEEYLAGNHRLKVWYCPWWPKGKQITAVQDARERLALPWWRTMYDPLGIFGQWLGLPWIQMPWMKFCSEYCSDALRTLEPSLTLKHPSPSQLDAWAKGNPRMRVWGRWEPD